MPTFDPKHEAATERYQTARRLDGTKDKYTPYEYGKTDLVLAINAALVTKRPLLLRGEPGSGKSTVAYDVAVALGWDYYEQVISSRTTSSDLLWQYDAIQRLNDAAPNAVLGDLAKYVRSQPLWWVLDPTTAKNYGPDPVRERGTVGGAVYLLDEIDKADPDLANDLLVPLGEGRFRVPELERLGEGKGTVSRTRKDVLIVITSNGERELPPAFLRRCVCLALATPDAEQLKVIAKTHMPELAERSDWLHDIVTRMFDIRDAGQKGQHLPGTAEILDAIRACRDLKIHKSHDDWKALTLAMGWKNPEDAPDSIRK